MIRTTCARRLVLLRVQDQLSYCGCTNHTLSTAPVRSPTQRYFPLRCSLPSFGKDHKKHQMNGVLSADHSLLFWLKDQGAGLWSTFPVFGSWNQKCFFVIVFGLALCVCVCFKLFCWFVVFVVFGWWFGFGFWKVWTLALPFFWRGIIFLLLLWLQQGQRNTPPPQKKWTKKSKPKPCFFFQGLGAIGGGEVWNKKQRKILSILLLVFLVLFICFFSVCFSVCLFFYCCPSLFFIVLTPLSLVKAIWERRQQEKRQETRKKQKKLGKTKEMGETS